MNKTNTCQVCDNPSSNNSNNGLITKIWGPGLWVGLHSITFGYPQKPTKDDKKNFREFFILVGEVLPCKYCRESYRNFITTGSTKLTDSSMENRETLTKWLYCLHEAVNNKLGVDYGVSFEDVKKRYEAYRAKCGKVDAKIQGCITPVINKKISYQFAENIDCSIIPPKIAKYFVDYAKIRKIDPEYLDNMKNLIKKYSKRDIPEWKERNKKCRNIINDMRCNGISPLEESGEWKGMPTIEETKLILMLTSNLTNEELTNLIHKLPNIQQKCKKLYKIINKN